MLESKGWAVDLDLCDLPCSGPPVEVLEPSNTQQDRIDYIEKRLKKLWDPIDTNNTYAPQKRTALVLKNSHVGGHKFAGNVIVRLLLLFSLPLYRFYWGHLILNGFPYADLLPVRREYLVWTGDASRSARDRAADDYRGQDPPAAPSRWTRHRTARLQVTHRMVKLVL